jgi:hypothetical protein
VAAFMHIMVNPITDGLPSDQVKNATKTSKRLNLTPGTRVERKDPKKKNNMRKSKKATSQKKKKKKKKIPSNITSYQNQQTQKTNQNKTYASHGLKNCVTPSKTKTKKQQTPVTKLKHFMHA